MSSEPSRRETGATVFVGGIMQGSIQEMAVHDQTYRARIAAVVRRHHPEVEVVDPAQLHPDSVSYHREQAVQTFLDSLDRAAASDALIAYLPEASMGTALEIWRAYAAGKPVFVISPMSQNWMLWATATRIFADLDAFSAFVAAGGLAPHLGLKSAPGAT
ncbi:MAG: nucleoside 2-deoxyribosyltransferase [Anaerolineae bacterium]|nr:nucleoside 2-deoxyribosyltransferase [Anaerolineae bacterium]